MTDRPILFSAPMVRALLDGRKTQTRRIFKGTEQNENGMWHVFGSGGGIIGVGEEDVCKEAVDYLPIQVGDRLWVRETWRADASYDNRPPSEMYVGADIWWEADKSSLRGLGAHPGKLRPSLFMPRWASRLTLIVTDVRVERLQAINERDAVAEGCLPDDTSLNPQHIGPATSIYAHLWDSINGPGAWEANPWVAAYTFTVHRCNIDKIGGAA